MNPVADNNRQQRAVQAVTLAPLVARVRKELKLGIPDAMGRVREYLQFLDSKVARQDWDDSVVVPSAQVRQIWELHILDTKRYGDECQKLCGRKIHYKPVAVAAPEVEVPPVVQVVQAVAARYNLTVKTLYKAHALELVDGNITVSDLKAILSVVTNICKDSQRLIFAGRVLEDDKTLANYNILSESSIHLSQNMRGC
jgi:hypothetical protein